MTRHAAKLSLDLFYVLKQSASALQQELAGLGEFHATRMAQQQIGVKFLLQLSNLQAKGRLGDIELLGSARDVSDLCDPHEILKLSEIDLRLLWQCKTPIMSLASLVEKKLIHHVHDHEARYRAGRSQRSIRSNAEKRATLTRITKIIVAKTPGRSYRSARSLMS